MQLSVVQALKSSELGTYGFIIPFQSNGKNLYFTVSSRRRVILDDNQVEFLAKTVKGLNDIEVGDLVACETGVGREDQPRATYWCTFEEYLEVLVLDQSERDALLQLKAAANDLWYQWSIVIPEYIEEDVRGKLQDATELLELQQDLYRATKACLEAYPHRKDLILFINWSARAI